MTTLTGPRAEAKSGTTKSLVILLHGYGADGNDLFGLHQALAEYMPDTVFRSPNAPEKCSVNPMGYQWFPIPWIDGSAEEAMREGFIRSAEILDTYLTEAMAEEGVTEAETVLIGFSQGTMMSLSVGPRRAAQFAGIVGFSGRLIDEAIGLAQSRPPVLLIHGDQDEVIDVAALDEAKQGLEAAGFEVYSHISAGTGHGIAPDGLGLALGFICDKLGIELKMPGQ
ncbi:dienelactone hydrolase family protein [Rhodobacteraceae bacterium NNCM2]|nr:dienelactone hydrolase family protein [Coraliihabitans acroporae]